MMLLKGQRRTVAAQLSRRTCKRQSSTLKKIAVKATLENPGLPLRVSSPNRLPAVAVWTGAFAWCKLMSGQELEADCEQGKDSSRQLVLSLRTTPKFSYHLIFEVVVPTQITSSRPSLLMSAMSRPDTAMSPSSRAMCFHSSPVES